jgi:hypothetical protein
MANDIKEALKKATAKPDVGIIVEGEGAEESKELSPRQKIILAKKMNLQRRKRNKLPSALR